MKIAIKNFLTTLRRYKVASVLNIAGMTLAFLAFYVIMSPTTVRSRTPTVRISW